MDMNQTIKIEPEEEEDNAEFVEMFPRTFEFDIKMEDENYVNNHQEFIDDDEVIDLDGVNKMKIEFSEEKVKAFVKNEQSLFIMNENLEAETSSVSVGERNTMKFRPKSRKKAPKIKPCVVVIEKCRIPESVNSIPSKDRTILRNKKNIEKRIEKTSEANKKGKGVRKKQVQKTLESTFHCKYCEKSFPFLSKLERHTKVHTKVRPFKCKDCGKGFTEESNLKTHINCFHKGLRPYKCDLCDKSFGRNGDLKSHKEGVHEGVTVDCPNAERMDSIPV